MRHIWIASCGCWHSNWDAQFYPDDLPPNWRLCYYSNEFSAIFLQHQEWVAQPTRNIEVWMEDCNDRFEFLLQIEFAQFEANTGLLDKALENLAIMSSQVSALIFNAMDASLPKYWNLFIQAVPHAEIFIQGEDGAVPENSRRLQSVDNADDEIRSELLLVSFQPTPKLMAQWLKAIIASGRSGGLIFCGEAPSVESLRQGEGLLPYLLP